MPTRGQRRLLGTGRRKVVRKATDDFFGLTIFSAQATPGLLGVAEVVLGHGQDVHPQPKRTGSACTASPSLCQGLSVTRLLNTS